MSSRLALAVLVAVVVVVTGCSTPVYEKPPAMVGGRPIRTGPDPVEVEHADLLLSGDGAFHHYDRYLSADDKADYLVVRRGLHGPDPNVHVSEQVPGTSQVVLAGGSGSSSQVYSLTSPPTHALGFPTHGRVLSVDPSGWTVLVSLSRGQPVRPGDHVLLVREGRFVGYARLMEIADNGSTALLLDAPGTTPARPGDAVSYYTPQGF